jgi:hypothetical protein
MTDHPVENLLKEGMRRAQARSARPSREVFHVEQGRTIAPNLTKDRKGRLAVKAAKGVVRVPSMTAKTVPIPTATANPTNNRAALQVQAGEIRALVADVAALQTTVNSLLRELQEAQLMEKT